MRMISLREKILVNNLILTCLVLVGVSLYSYYSISTIRKQTITENLQGRAQVIASNLAKKIKEEVAILTEVAQNSNFIALLQQANTSYGTIPDRQAYFDTMDQQWRAATQESPLVKKYTDIPAAAQLRRYDTIMGKIGEVFISDRFGGLVAASGKTTDFYQADETWWQKAISYTKEKPYIGQIEFDESSQAWSIPALHS